VQQVVARALEDAHLEVGAAQPARNLRVAHAVVGAVQDQSRTRQLRDALFDVERELGGLLAGASADGVVHEFVRAPGGALRAVARQRLGREPERACGGRVRLLEQFEQPAGRLGRREARAPARRQQDERGHFAGTLECEPRRVERAQTLADQGLGGDRQAVGEVLLDAREIAHDLLEPGAVATRAFRTTVAAHVGQCDRPTLGGEHVRRLEIARAVVARVVDDRHSAARFAVRGDLQHVQEE
jgi:hypothetical protein